MVAWPAAGFRVAGALHSAFWRSCCARGRRLARGWLSCDTGPAGGVAARVVAAWPARVVAAWHTTFDTPSFTPLCHTPSFTHTIFHTQLCHTPSLTHHFVTHHLSHTIFVTPLCHTPSVTHHLSHHAVTHHLSHTTLSDTIFHTQLCHTPSFTTPSLTHHL